MILCIFLEKDRLNNFYLIKIDTKAKKIINIYENTYRQKMEEGIFGLQSK